MIITNQDVRKKMLEGGSGYEISALLKQYFKEGIRVKEVTSAENRDILDCGNYAVIVSPVLCNTEDMEHKKLIDFAEGLFI